jgi:hypothetical protein
MNTETTQKINLDKIVIEMGKQAVNLILLESRIEELEKENTRLKEELSTLKPKEMKK